MLFVVVLSLSLVNMAENVAQKSPKLADKNKYSNVVQRTTSETLRLGEAEAVNSSNNLLTIGATTRKKPCSSFQITSVVVGRMNNDGGDDSADDLDESHADDMSDVVDNSRVTDNETPSYSEDTYSKEEVFFNVSSSSLCSAPVIPTSSQYGLAVVPPGSAGNPVVGSNNAAATTASNNNLNAASNAVPAVVSATNISSLNASSNNNNAITSEVLDVNLPVNNSSALEAPTTVVAKELHEAPEKDMSNRFKVVKIESTEPFKRGRWMCMDYLDHTINQNTQFAQQRKTDVNASVVQPSAQYLASENHGITEQQNMQQVRQQNLVQSMPQQAPAAYYGQQQVQSQSGVAMSHMQTSQQPLGQYQQQYQPQMVQHVQQPQQHVMQQRVQVQPQQYVQQQHVQQMTPQQHAQQQQQQMRVQQPQVQMQQQVHPQQQVLNQQVRVQQQQPPIHVVQQQQQQVHAQQPQSHGHQQTHLQQQIPPRVVPNQVPTSLGYNTMQQPPAQCVIPANVVQSSSATMIPTQIRSQQNIVQQPQVSGTSGAVYNQQGQIYSPANSNVMPSQQQQYMTQQPHMVGQSYGNQIVYTQPATVSTGVPPLSYAGQPSIVHNVSAQGQNYVGQSQTNTVTTQGQSYAGQASQIIGNVHVQGQSYSGPATQVSNPNIPTQAQSFPSQQQTPHTQQPQNQTYISQPQTKMQQQTFVTTQTGPIQQTYVSQQQPVGPQGSYVPSVQPQVYTSVPQHQNYVMSMPSSPAGISQQPVYSTVPSQPQTYTQQPQQIQQHLQQQQQQMQHQQRVQQQMPPIPQQVIQQQQQQQQQQRMQQSQVPVQQMQQIPQVHVQPRVPQPVQISPQVRMQQVPQSQVQQQQSVRMQSPQTQILQNQVSQTQVQPPQQRMQYMGQTQTPTYTQAQQPPATVQSNQPQYQQAATHPEGASPLDSKPAVGVENALDTPDDDNKTEETDSRSVPRTVIVTLPQTPSAPPAVTNLPSTPSAAGNSAVAIDNKIEQAMDLVKSHLMFAVREEVEVLKERIAELMDRINQLETENSILKTHATPDTLALLTLSVPQTQVLPGVQPSGVPAVVNAGAVGAALTAAAVSVAQSSPASVQSKMSPGTGPGAL